MFHRVRSEVLQTAIDRLEPRPSRAASVASIAARTCVSAELEEENLRLQLELKAAEVRRELAEKLPRLAKPQKINPAAEPGKKNDCAARKNRRRKRLQRNTKRPKPMNPINLKHLPTSETRLARLSSPGVKPSATCGCMPWTSATGPRSKGCGRTWRPGSLVWRPAHWPSGNIAGVRMT